MADTVHRFAAANDNTPDLRDLRDLFVHVASGNSHSSDPALWAAIFPFTPQDAHAASLDGVDRAIADRLSLTLRGNRGSICLKIEGLGLSFTSAFSPARKIANDSDMIIPDDMMRHGLGRRLLYNHLHFLRTAGIDHMTIIAGRTNGAYAWARMGFSLIAPADELRALNRAIHRNMMLIESRLDRRDRFRAEETLPIDSTGMLWQLADLPIDAGPALRDIHATRVAAGAPPDDAALRLCNRFAASALAGKSVPLGNVLLSAANWDGLFTLNDATQWARARAYVTQDRRTVPTTPRIDKTPLDISQKLGI